MALADRFSPIFVTGASGFVGACLVRRLVDAGFDVHVALRPAARLWRLEGILSRLHVHGIDVTDAAAVAATMRAVRPKAVLHLAAYGAYESQADARRILEVNVDGGFNVLEASVEAGALVFVNAGSSSEYGYKREPMREEDALEPASHYAVSKAAMTHLVALAGRKQQQTATATLRLFSVYGPWEEPTRLFPTVLGRLLAGRPLDMTSPDTARDYVYVDDVLDAFLSLPALAERRGDVINIGTGVQTTLREVVEAAQAAVGRTGEVRWGGMPARSWDTNRWQAAPPGKARALLDWTPRHSLRAGIEKMVAWMKTAPEVYAY